MGITSLLELTAVCHRRGRQAKVRRINSKMKTKEMPQLATLQPAPPTCCLVGAGGALKHFPKRVLNNRSILNVAT
eukprot:g18529.t1